MGSKLKLYHYRLVWSVDFFRDGLGLQEQQKIIFSARLGIRSRHVEAAKGMRANHRAGALAV